MGNPSEKTMPMWLFVGAGMIVFALIVAASCGHYWRTLVLGACALGTFAFSALYAVRKRLFLSRLGSLYAWMLGHVVLGVVLFLFVVLHAGFVDIGTQGLILYALVIVETGSGLWGLHELKQTPRRFERFAKDDFMHPSAIRTRIGRLREEIDRMLARREELVPWYEARYARIIATPFKGSVHAFEAYPKGSKRHAQLLHDTAEELHRLSLLQVEIDAAHRASRRWLYLHVPTSVALVTFVGIHLIGWLYYG